MFNAEAGKGNRQFQLPFYALGQQGEGPPGSLEFGPDIVGVVQQNVAHESGEQPACHLAVRHVPIAGRVIRIIAKRRYLRGIPQAETSLYLLRHRGWYHIPQQRLVGAAKREGLQPHRQMGVAFDGLMGQGRFRPAAFLQHSGEGRRLTLFHRKCNRHGAASPAPQHSLPLPDELRAQTGAAVDVADEERLNNSRPDLRRSSGHQQARRLSQPRCGEDDSPGILTSAD